MWVGLFQPHTVPTAPKPPSDQAQQQAKAPHAGSAAQPLGTLTKNSSYSTNGWNYIGTDGGRQAPYKSCPDGYAFFSATLPANFHRNYPRPKLVRKKIEDALAAAKQAPASAETVEYIERLLARCPGKKGGRGSVGQALPYAWDGHHMLPQEAFDKYLESSDRDVIVLAPYDINGGRNLILLPSDDACWKYHKLPAHVDNHPKYTDGLESKFQQIKNSIAQLKKDKLPHEAIAASIEQDLHDLEDDQFEAIVDLGRTGPAPVRLP